MPVRWRTLYNVIVAALLMLWTVQPGLAQEPGRDDNKRRPRLGGPDAVENQLETDREEKDVLYESKLLKPYFEWQASLKEKHGENAKAIMTVLERTKFRELVRPGDTLIYSTEVMAISKSGGKTIAEALCNGRTVATTGMVFAFKHVDDAMLESKRDALMKVWLP